LPNKKQSTRIELFKNKINMENISGLPIQIGNNKILESNGLLTLIRCKEREWIVCMLRHQKESSRIIKGKEFKYKECLRIPTASEWNRYGLSFNSLYRAKQAFDIISNGTPLGKYVIPL
jgi:hypothetical protein